MRDKPLDRRIKVLAEREGFEPPLRFPVNLISSISYSGTSGNKRQENAGKSESESPLDLSALAAFYPPNWAKIGMKPPL